MFYLALSVAFLTVVALVLFVCTKNSNPNKPKAIGLASFAMSVGLLPSSDCSSSVLRVTKSHHQSRLPTSRGLIWASIQALPPNCHHTFHPACTPSVVKVPTSTAQSQRTLFPRDHRLASLRCLLFVKSIFHGYFNTHCRAVAMGAWHWYLQNTILFVHRSTTVARYFAVPMAISAISTCLGSRTTT